MTKDFRLFAFFLFIGYSCSQTSMAHEICIPALSDAVQARTAEDVFLADLAFFDGLARKGNGAATNVDPSFFVRFALQLQNEGRLLAFAREVLENDALRRWRHQLRAKGDRVVVPLINLILGDGNDAPQKSELIAQLARHLPEQLRRYFEEKQVFFEAATDQELSQLMTQVFFTSNFWDEVLEVEHTSEVRQKVTKALFLILNDKTFSFSKVKHLESWTNLYRIRLNLRAGSELRVLFMKGPRNQLVVVKISTREGIFQSRQIIASTMARALSEYPELLNSK